MKISFKIEEKWEELISLIHDESHGKYLVREVECNDSSYMGMIMKEHFPSVEKLLLLEDLYFHSDCRVEIYETKIIMTTAMSSFSYVFYKKEDNQVKCTYFGAFNGFKQQYLLPEFNIIKSSVYCKSSLSPQLMSWDRMLEFKKDLMYGEIQ